MKQIISRLKNISMMLIWDVITAIALFVFAYFSLDRMPSTMYKVLILCGVALFVIIMLVIKYQLLYKKYGRDDVTGGKNKKEFENVYYKNKFNVYRIAMDYSGSHKESAEEIFQEVFLKLYTHFDTVDEEYMAAWLVTTTKNTAINYMKKRARECPKADIELFSDLYSKEYAESAEEHVFHKILQKEKVGYGWTILDALYEENENWYEAITMVYCLERKQKDVAESMGISIQALTGVLYRARKWVKIHYNSDDYTK